ncbi:unnamed protein product [Adineta steineri]|uniref:Uncharacterized protein n=1 Tax=Adineta steineri TaxID=433720 RepID=A0A813QQK7_9BILA|nr:unnamed protein product [Adineta steineri]CAF0771681.1 unnamed protein product [Adineta steineri]
MSKKANLRQTQMITLGDYHRQEIEDINRDIKNMTKEYKQKKKGISTISCLMKEYQLELIRKSQLLLEAKHELKTMDGYRIIREQQSDEIKRLEEEIKLIRSKHVHEIAHVKSTYEKEIRQQRRSTDIKIAEIQRRANQDVEETLHARIISIAKENAELEDKIENIIQRKQKLHQLKQHLEDEQIHLIRHLKFVTDLRKINLNTASFNITNNSYKSIQY